MPGPDINKLNEAITTLKLILRSKITHNKAISDSFRVEDGVVVVVVSTEQKSAFDKNMSDIRAINVVFEILQREIE